MPTIEIDSIALIDLQNKLRHEGFEAPDSIPTSDEWTEKMVAESDKDNPHPMDFIEQYPHEFGLDRALQEVLEACPICGDTECDRGVSWIGSSPIHADQHPEAKTERAMDNRGVYY